MTVGELIEQLKTLDPTTPVVKLVPSAFAERRLYRDALAIGQVKLAPRGVGQEFYPQFKAGTLAKRNTVAAVILE